MALPWLIATRFIIRTSRTTASLRRTQQLRRDARRNAARLFAGGDADVRKVLQEEQDIRRRLTRLQLRRVRIAAVDTLADLGIQQVANRVFARLRRDGGRAIGPGAFVIRRKFKDATPTLRGIRRDQQQNIGDSVVDRLRSPKWWPKGPERGRRYYPVRSGLRFYYRRSGNQVRIKNPAPYFAKVNAQGDYVNKAVNATLQERHLQRQYGTVLNRWFRRL